MSETDTTEGTGMQSVFDGEAEAEKSKVRELTHEEKVAQNAQIFISEESSDMDKLKAAQALVSERWTGDWDKLEDVLKGENLKLDDIDDFVRSNRRRIISEQVRKEKEDQQD